MKSRYRKKFKEIRHYYYKKRKDNKYRSRISNRKNNQHATQNSDSHRTLVSHYNRYKSFVIDKLNSYGFVIEKFYASKKVYLEVPSIFCFSKNTNETIFFLKKLYTCLMDDYVTHIHFNHLNCKYIGICASTVMDIIIEEGKKYRKSINNDIKFSGELENGNTSREKEVDRLLKSNGLLHNLGIYKQTVPNTEVLNVIKNGQSGTVAEKTIDYINKALMRHNLKLSKEGINYFCTFIGEIVDNCKLHGGENVTWYTSGYYYYDYHSKTGKCKLCIIDFGDTIYESMKKSENPKLNSNINKYSKKYWFSFKTVKSKETLYTLFSLQQRVSRMHDKTTIRGNGTVTFIDSLLKFFNSDISGNNSIFSITSGKCSILFDGTYRLHENSFVEQTSNKIIAFNSTNSLMDEPDQNYVRTIANGFPGTIISMDLFIDKKYLLKE